MKHFATPDSHIIPELLWSDMQPRLIERLRMQAVAHNPEHAWKDLHDEALLHDAGLARLNPDTGMIGFTLGALLLVGTDAAFRARFPMQGQGTQAVYRPGKWRRGEREDLRMNLLETHDRLMAFAARHLPDAIKTTPNGETINLRDTILSEVFANSLIFRDYARPFPARFVIEADRVFMENGMAPARKSDPKSSPNPLLANVFTEIGLGRKQAAKSSQASLWGKAYFGMLPMVVEGSVYRILAPFPKNEIPSPSVSTSWDISDMFSTQAPWTQSKAAQNEVDLTRNALNDLVKDPMLVAVKAMQDVAMQDIAKQGLKPTMQAMDLDTLESARTMHVSGSGIQKPSQTMHAGASTLDVPKPNMQAPLSVPSSPTPVFETHPYANGFTSGHIPTATIPTPVKINQGIPHSERTEKILEFCKTPRYRSELQAHVGIVNRDYFRKDILNPLIEKGLLEPTLPDKPNSPKQQYATVGR